MKRTLSSLLYALMLTSALGQTAPLGPNGVGNNGGSGTPGGTNGQVQYNNSGAFGGFTVGGDGSLNTGTGALTVTKTNGTTFGALATITPGTGIATALTNGFGSTSTTIAQGNDARFPTGNWPTTTGNLNFLNFNGIGGAPQDSGTSWANPGAFGTGTPNTGAFTSISVSGITTLTGPSLTGSQTTSPFTLAQTRNTSGNAAGVTWTFTDTAVGASANLFQILGGAAGTTNEFKVDKSGNITVNGVWEGSFLNVGDTTLGNGNAKVYSGSNVLSLQNAMAFGWPSGSSPSTTLDTAFSRDSAGVVDCGTGAQGNKGCTLNLTNLGGGGRATFGSTTLAAGQAGDLAQIKETDAAAAPGAGYAVLKWVAGSAGSCNLIAYAGTSTMPVTIASTVGSGC
jgi:hypothetical protein